MSSQENPVVVKSRLFAIRIVNLYKYLSEEKNEYVLSKQILRSGTSIGANISEAQYGQSEADFYSKMSIALKEAAETEYWLTLLHETGYVNDVEYNSIGPDCNELLKLLTSITKKQKISNR